MNLYFKNYTNLPWGKSSYIRSYIKYIYNIYLNSQICLDIGNTLISW